MRRILSSQMIFAAWFTLLLENNRYLNITAYACSFENNIQIFSEESSIL
jgi:hypothetical protein